MLHGLIEVLFPRQCAACDAIGDGLCRRCAPHDAPVMRRDLPTLAVTALAEYDGAFRRAVLALKDGRRDVGEALGERLAVIVPSGSVLVPVPTTRARRWARGFDGVVLIARIAGLRADAQVATALAPRGGDAQRGRNRAGRIAAHGRFACSDLVRGTHVVLVDDVCTTGATLEDCATALRAAGASVTQAIVVASANRGA